MRKQPTKSNSCALSRIIKATFTAGLLPALVLLFSIQASQAGSATWNLSPTSGDWDTAVNWAPTTVPNGASDIATFGVSNTSAVNVSAPTTVDSLHFKTGASPYTISASISNSGLTINGAGILNQSGKTQTFVALPNATGFEGGSYIAFRGSARPGEMTSFVGEGSSVVHSLSNGFIAFLETSSAGNASLTATAANFGGEIQFAGSATAANAVITNQGGGADPVDSPGSTAFFENSTAGNCTITNEAGTAPGYGTGAQLQFYDTSSGGSATIINKGTTVRGAAGGRTTFFYNAPNAGNCTIINEGSSVQSPGGGSTIIDFNASAGAATIVAEDGLNDGGFIDLLSDCSGGTARIQVYGKGKLWISAHAAPGVTIGSLEGDGLVSLGTHNLTVGSNDLSTLYSGVMQEKLGGTGSLTKIGTGTLTLAGASNYSGVTTVSQGALLVANTSGSATGSGPVQVDAGTFGGIGSVSGAVTVATGTGTGAFLAPGTKGPGTLTLTSILTFKTGSGYKCELGLTAQPKSDQVTANGVTIESGARFALRTKGNRTLPAGTSFTVISNTAAIPISGTFSNLADGSTLLAGNNTFQVSYEGGDGNDLTMTVVIP